MNKPTVIHIDDIAKKLKQRVSDWKSITVDIARGLHIANKYYSRQGIRADLTTNVVKLKTWGDFCVEVGINIRKAQRYIERYEPKSDMLITTEQLKNKKQKQQIADQQIISERIKTGKKPDDWHERLDREFKKRTDDDYYQDQKSRAFKSEPMPQPKQSVSDDFIKNLHDQSQTRAKVKSEILKDDSPLFYIIEKHLSELSSDNERLEALHDIIKFSKRLATKYQMESIAS